MTITRTIATVAVAAAASFGAVTVGTADASSPAQAPPTVPPTVPPTSPAAPTTQAGAPTTFDQTTGPVSTPSTSGTLPVYTTCEQAIQPPTSTEPCPAAAVEGFNLFGGKLGLLYASDLPISLGVWAPVGDHDWEFNESVLYACISVLKGEDDLVWLDYQLLTFTDYSASANEKLFDAAMTYVCPELQHTRSSEWDFHVPAEVAAQTPTTVPVGTVAVTTVPGVPTVPATAAVPTVPATTTGVIPTVPTVPPTAGTTTQIRTADGPRDFTCADIISIRDTVTPCDATVQALFDSIVAADPAAFDTYVYNQGLGWFSTNEVTVPETAFVGLWACANASTGVAFADYDNYVRGVFPAANPADTQRAWDVALATLCPSVAAG